MKKATIFMFSLFLLAGTAQAQQVDYTLGLPATEVITDGYAAGLQSGARDIAGPFDLDADGQFEVLVSDYTGGGRVHVLENIGADTWELVYSTPWMDSTATSNNIRAIAGGDLDGDGFGEIVFLSGRNFGVTTTEQLPAGLFVFENVGDNDFGTAPASIYEFDGDLPDRWRTEVMDIYDVDGDGTEELLISNNGGDNRYDNWYVISATDIGGGFDVWTTEVRLSSRATEDFDPVGRGGGSAYAAHPADLDGNGNLELVLHSWNNFNFTNISTDGAGGYVIPDASAPNLSLQVSPEDQVSFFGGVVADIDGNGDDEVFFPNLQSGAVTVMNYESGEDVMQLTMDNFSFDAIPGFSTLGITAGDLDGDGAMELIGTGPGYAGATFQAGSPAAWVNVVEFNGGDPEDPANYSEVEAIEISTDTYNGFHTLNNLDGSTTYTSNDLNMANPDSITIGNTNPEFASKLTYLSDIDNDGVNEVAFGIQGVRDALYVLQQNADSSYSVTSSSNNENRVFMRVMSGSGIAVSIEDERIIVPSDYKLHSNYPNPFNPTTTISFTLPLDKAVSVRVYDMTGRLVRTLANNQFYSEGFHEVSWDATNDAGNQVASGSYLYTLEYGNFRQSKTMVLIK
ncbi:MAG: FG-GAP-like repeat-containing protein [Rhodothermales bacterium]